MDDPQFRESDWSDCERHPLIPPLAAVCLGIMVARYFDVAFWCWCIGLSTSLAGWLVALRQNTARLGLVLLLAASFFLGGAIVQKRFRLYRPDELGLTAGTRGIPVCMRARAASAPTTQLGNDPWSPHTGPMTRLLIRVQEIRDGPTWRQASGQVAVRVRGELDPSILPDDRLLLWGTLYRSAPPSNPGEIDRAHWDRSQHLLCHLQVSGPECVEVLRQGRASCPARWLEMTRGHSRLLFAKYVPPSEVALATALILGTREQLDRDVTLAFLETGMVHILAISGLHLGMLVWVIWLLARTGWLSRRAALWISIAVVGPYAILTGAQAPVIRAAALAIFLSSGRLMSRPVQGWNLLAASALAVLCLDPLGLFQIGVQLSFLAVATLGHCSRIGAAPMIHDPLQRLVLRSRPWWKRKVAATWRSLIRIWGTSLFVWLISLPLIVYRFHVASPIAVFLNPLLWAPIALALFTGFGVLAFGDLCPPMAHLCGWLCGVSLRWSQRGIFGSSGVAMGHWWMPGPALWLVVAFYVGVFLWAAFPRVRPRWWISVSLLVGWFMLWLAQLILQQVALRRDETLRITFFCVGHGTCVLVELPYGKAFLYDAGRMGSPYSLAGSVTNEIWSRGRFGIDAVVLSHADMDHFNAVGPIVERVKVHRVLAAPHVLESQSPLLINLRSLLRSQSVDLQSLDDRRPFPLPSAARLIVLHPPLEEVPGSDNANSVVLVIQYEGVRILLPGDLEGGGLRRLLAMPALRCQIVMAPHHGSVRSSPEAVATWSSASSIVLSDKEPPGARWFDVSRRYNVNVLDTYTHHAIRCEVKENQVHWSCWDGYRWERQL